MDRQTREKVEELAHQYPHSWANCLENAMDMGHELMSDAETMAAYRMLLNLVDAGEAA